MINFCCHFQDQGGIYIGDGSLIGSQVVIATINHDLNPVKRADNHPAPVHIGKKVCGCGKEFGKGARIRSDNQDARSRR